MLGKVGTGTGHAVDFSASERGQRAKGKGAVRNAKTYDQVSRSVMLAGSFTPSSTV